MKIKSIGLLAGLALVASSGAFAQKYPEKTITMIVPFSAGGPTDTVARLIAQAMSNDLGQQVIVETAPSSPRASPRPSPTATPCCCTTSACPPRPACTAS